MNSTSELSRELQKSSKNFLLLDWKKKDKKMLKPAEWAVSITVNMAALKLKQIYAFWAEIVIGFIDQINEMISFYALPFKRGCDFQRIPYRIALKQI